MIPGSRGRQTAARQAAGHCGQRGTVLSEHVRRNETTTQFFVT